MFPGKNWFGFVYDINTELYINGQATDKAEHYTVLFQAFVMMTVFNEVNARKIGPDELNVFKGFFNNFYFIFILILSVGIQFLMVEVGGELVKVRPLDWKEHLICIGLGAFSIVWCNDFSP